MEAYIRVFVHFKWNDWARLLLIAEFAYNNVKNVSTGHMPFKLNYVYYPCMSYEKDIDPCFGSKTVEELLGKLQELISTCCENLNDAQELQK